MNIFHKYFSILILVFLVFLDFKFHDGFYPEYQIYITTGFNLSLLYFYRAQSTFRSYLLDVFIILYTIGDFILFQSPLDKLNLDISILIMCLSTLILGYLVSKCSFKANLKLYAVGPLLYCPYLVVMSFHLAEPIGGSLFVVLLKFLINTFLVSVAFAHFIKYHSWVDSFVILGIFLSNLSKIMMGYDHNYLGGNYFSNWVTLTDNFGHLFFILFLMYRLGEKKIIYTR